VWPTLIAEYDSRRLRRSEPADWCQDCELTADSRHMLRRSGSIRHYSPQVSQQPAAPSGLPIHGRLPIIAFSVSENHDS